MRALLLLLVAACLSVFPCWHAYQANPPVLEEAETLTQQALITAYSSVFRVKGGATVVGFAPPVSYAADRLRVLLDIHGEQIDLARVRSLDQPTLLRLLFLAVAGDYVTGPAALHPVICRIEADPFTGTLDVVSGKTSAENALTVIAVVLLLVIVVFTYRKEEVHAKQ